MLDWAMARPEFKTQLFRFVDVFPALAGNDDVARHLVEYFEGVPCREVLDLGVDVGRPRAVRSRHRSSGRPPQHHADGRAVHRRSDARRGRRRVAPAVAHRERRRRSTCSARRRSSTRRPTGTRRGSTSCCATLAAASGALGARRSPRARRPRADPTGQREHQADRARRPLRAADARESGSSEAKARIRPILAARPRAGRVRALRHGALRRQGPHAAARSASCSTEPDLADVDAGIVIQAYSRDSRDDLADLIALVRDPDRADHGAPGEGRVLGHRDRARPRPRAGRCPVFEHKAETDANYERCVRLLHDHHGEVRAAFATHNLRSLAYAIAYARSQGHPRHRLRGADALRHGRADAGRGPRAAGCGCGCTRPSASWCPAWPTSCAGCSRTRPTRASSATASPRAASSTSCSRAPMSTRCPAAAVRLRAQTDAIAETRRPTSPSRSREWRRAPVRARPSRSAVDERRRHGRRSTCPAVIGGERVRTAATIDSVDPGRLRAGRRPRAASCDATHADAAVAAALRRRRAVAVDAGGERAGVLFRAAALDAGPPRPSSPRSRCSRPASPGTRPTPTCARPSTSASTTAARCCASTARPRPRAVAAGRAQPPDLPGQGGGGGDRAVELPARHPDRHDRRRARGRQPRDPEAGRADAGRSRAQLVEAFAAAGLPRGVLQFLPGCGEDVGARLVEHPDVARHRLHRLEGRRACTSTRSPRDRPPGPAPRQAGDRRDGRQERDRDRRRRRPRPGRARRRDVRLRLRRPEVLGCVPGHRRRPGLRRRSSNAWSPPTAEVVVGHPSRHGDAGRPGDRRRRARAADRRRSRRRAATGTVHRVGADDVPAGGLVRRARRSWRSTIPTAPVGPGRAVRPGAGRLRVPATSIDAIELAERHRLRAHRRPVLPVAASHRPRASRTCGPATSTSTGARPVRSSDASRSVATGCRASAPRPAAPTICCSSSTRGRSPRTRCAKVSQATHDGQDERRGRRPFDAVAHS